MISFLRNALARRAGARAVRERQRRPMRLDATRRVALVVLPETREDAKAAWKALEVLGLDPERIVPVALDAVAYVPDRYAGRILIAPRAGALRLPTPASRSAAWDPAPDVAINLLDPRDPAGALLVGGSPSALRVGYADRRAETFYDLLVGAPGESSPDPGAVARALAQLRPPLFGPT